MTKDKNNPIEKSARLIVLMRMQDAGRLSGLSLQAIANKFTSKPNRSTIMRDLRDLESLRALLAEMEKTL